MKKSILLIAFISIVSLSFGQVRSEATSGNCFKDWYSLFKERGADPVPDGTNEVIISIRNGEYSECFLGKIDVLGGNLAGNFQVQKVDGTYGSLDKGISSAYLGSDGRLKEELRAVTDGMTSTALLKDGESIRLFFYKSLKEKAKANKRAPSPSQLVKN